MANELIIELPAAVEKAMAMAEVAGKNELIAEKKEPEVKAEIIPTNEVLQINKTKSHIEDHILKDFENFGIFTGDSKLILEAIKKGLIRHVYIRYE